jgi:hypothetical protein
MISRSIEHEDVPHLNGYVRCTIVIQGILSIKFSCVV